MRWSTLYKVFRTINREAVWLKNVTPRKNSLKLYFQRYIIDFQPYSVTKDKIFSAVYYNARIVSTTKYTEIKFTFKSISYKLGFTEILHHFQVEPLKYLICQKLMPANLSQHC